VQAAVVLAAARFAPARAVVPALGLFTGPLGGVLAAIAVCVTLARCGVRAPRLRPPALALFLLPALVASAVALHYAHAVEPSGDEIDYLMMTQSIWREGDLDLRDNFGRGDYLEYLGGYDYMPGGTRRADGRSYPTHSPGLPFIVAPVYALGGRGACLVFLALVAAGLGVATRALARHAGADEDAALVAWAAIVGPPVFFYTAFLYAEVVATFCLATALWLLLTKRGAGAAALAALLLSALPWLHVRLTLLAATMGLFALVTLRGRARLAFAAVASAMAAAFLGYHYWVFGSISPLARYGGAMPTPMVGRTPGRTLVGLFVDGSYGLLPYAPVFLLGFAGLGRLLAARRAVALALSAAFAAALLPVLGWRNWWGASPPARFTIPLLPTLAVALALRVAYAPGRGLARWRLPLLAAGFGLALFMFHEPREMHMVNGRNAPPAVFDVLAGEVSLSRYLPFFSSRAGSIVPPWNPPPTEAWVAGLWVAALAVLLALDRAARRRDSVDRWFSGLALPLLLFLALSLAVDHGVRPSGPPRYAPAPASPETGNVPAGQRFTMRSRPPMYGRSASGTTTVPSACW
jgi:hypothetical protein